MENSVKSAGSFLGKDHIVNKVRGILQRVVGGNCDDVADDLQLLEMLAKRAITAGLTEGLPVHLRKDVDVLLATPRQNLIPFKENDSQGLWLFKRDMEFYRAGALIELFDLSRSPSAGHAGPSRTATIGDDGVISQILIEARFFSDSVSVEEYYLFDMDQVLKPEFIYIEEDNRSVRRVYVSGDLSVSSNTRQYDGSSSKLSKFASESEMLYPVEFTAVLDLLRGNMRGFPSSTVTDGVCISPVAFKTSLSLVD